MTPYDTSRSSMDKKQLYIRCGRGSAVVRMRSIRRCNTPVAGGSAEGRVEGPGAVLLFGFDVGAAPNVVMPGSSFDCEDFNVIRKPRYGGS